ncbi:MAG: phosphopantetheine-binding protein [Bacteroidales bacterium]|nr:phosphopantetheine-binding protein [Bacteroidales bacterium]
MTREEIITTINTILVDDIEIDQEKINDNALLKKDLGIESLDFIDIVALIESNFGFKIKPEEMKNIQTLSQFYDYVESKLQ